MNKLNERKMLSKQVRYDVDPSRGEREIVATDETGE